MTPPLPPSTPPPAPDRRRVLLGLGALAVAPVVLAAGPAYAASTGREDSRGYEQVAEPSCLADLVEMGVVTREDYVAG